MRHPEGREFYTGQELELDTFGKPRFDVGYREALREVASPETGYVDYRRAQDLIREHYLDDPTNPGKPFPKDLLLEICDRLGLDPEETKGIGFFSAIGTPLDKFHGVDGWLETRFEDPTWGPVKVEVTFDVTQRPDKLEDGHKADMMIGELPDPDHKDYLKRVDRYAEEVVALLTQKMRSVIDKRRGPQPRPSTSPGSPRPASGRRVLGYSAR